MYNCVWYFCTYSYGLGLNGRNALFCIANNRHGVTITTHAIKRHFLIWMTTVRQPTKRRRSCVLTLKYTFICVYWWTRQRIHNTLIVVDRYLRRMGDKTIPDSAEPRLESFYPPFVAGIDLPHQGVLDSYNLHNGISYTGKMTSLYWIRAQFTIGAMSPWYNNCCRKFPWWYQRPSSGLFIRFGVISRAGAITWVQEPFLAVCHIMTSRGIAPSRALLISSQPIFSVNRAATSCLV